MREVLTEYVMQNSKTRHLKNTGMISMITEAGKTIKQNPPKLTLKELSLILAGRFSK